MFENFVVAAVIIAMLAVVCVVAYAAVMYVFPRIPATRRWMENLPDCDNKPDYWM